MDVVLTLKESDLEEITKLVSNKVVGRVLKRLEIGSDLATTKANIKELLYESFRDYEDLVFSKGCGGHTTKINFKTGI